MLFIVTIVMLLNGCRPESYKSIGTPTDAVSSLSGNWKLTRVIQTDENAKTNGFSYDPINVQTADLTSSFPFTDFGLTLNFSNGLPSTFTTAPGNSPKVIKMLSGKWVLDDPKYPKVISLINGTDTALITLGSYPLGSSPVLKIAQQKVDASDGTLLISYSYEFTKK